MNVALEIGDVLTILYVKIQWYVSARICQNTVVCISLNMLKYSGMYQPEYVKIQWYVSARIYQNTMVCISLNMLKMQWYVSV
jgi:hypothetical protein